MITYDEKTEVHLLYQALIDNIQGENALAMGMWWDRDGCHTTGCIAGWAGYLTDDVAPREGLSRWRYRQALKLRLTPDASDLLFLNLDILDEAVNPEILENVNNGNELDAMIVRVVVSVLEQMRGVLEEYPDFIFEEDNVEEYIYKAKDKLAKEVLG